MVLRVDTDGFNYKLGPGAREILRCEIFFHHEQHKILIKKLLTGGETYSSTYKQEKIVRNMQLKKLRKTCT